MRQVAMLLTGLLTALYFNGCASKCDPVVQYVKPSIPYIKEAEIKQCRDEELLVNIKCILVNYFEMKRERDQLRFAIEEISK